jgi:hypothetical protein
VGLFAGFADDKRVTDVIYLKYRSTMKTLSKVLVINGCILFLFGHSMSVSAQNPGPVAVPGGPAPYSPQPPARSAFDSRLQDLIERSSPQPAPPTFERTSPAWKKQVKEVDLEDLPMGEVIGWLRKEFPEVNFINAPEVENVFVKLKLRSVTLDDIFIALSITSKGEIVINPMNEKMVSIFYRPLAPKEQTPKKISQAFSLVGYLTGLSPDETTKALKDLEDALAVSWKMLQRANPEDQNFQPPQLNLHAPTKMLIAVGDGEQLEVIERFISQLERRPVRIVQPAPVAPAQPNPPSAPVPPPGQSGLRQIPERTLKLAPPPIGQPPTAPVAPAAPIRPQPTRILRPEPVNPSTNNPPSNN